MLLDMKKLFYARSEAIDVHGSFDLSGEAFPDCTPTGPAAAHIAAVWEDGAVTLTLSASMNVSFECARCLAPGTRRFSVDESWRVREADLEEEFPELPFTAGGKLDAGELVYTELALAVPSVLLCSEDCAGLCPVCGSRKPCSCRHETSGSADPRLEKLKQLLDE